MSQALAVQNEVKERPILFSGEMVRAILEGRKTQTRRLRGLKQINQSPDDYEFRGFVEPNGELHAVFIYKATGNQIQLLVKCPYGKAGDRLWMRETWAKDPLMPNGVRYYATDDVHELRRKRPSIFMPRWASRLTLENSGVRVERLQDISEEDALAEGVREALSDDTYSGCGLNSPFYLKPYTAKNAFKFGWDIINPKRGHTWEFNPYVWVVSFRRL